MAGIWTLLAALALARAQAPAARGAPALDRDADSRLAHPATVRLEGGTVARLLEDLSRQSAVALSADDEVTGAPVIVLARALPLDTLLRRVARLHGWEWARERAAGGQPGRPVYRLFRPPETAGREAREVRRWRDGARALAAGTRAILARLIDDAARYADLSPEEQERAAGRDPWLGMAAGTAGDALFGLLRGLAPGEREALAESALQPLGVIDAGGAHVAPDMRFGVPFDSLTPDQQGRIADLAAAGGPAADLSGATVGVCAAGNSIGLGVTRGDEGWLCGRGLMAPRYPEEYAAAAEAMQRARAGERGPATDLSAPEKQAALASRYGPITDDETTRDAVVPRSLADRKVGCRRVSPPERLAGFLAAIHDQTGLAVVADGLQRTSHVRHPWTLRDREEYPLADAASELSRIFRRRIRVEEGVLTVRSRHYAVGRLYEAPEALVRPWLGKLGSPGGLAFEDYASLAAGLTAEQLETLAETPARIVRRHAALFRLWNSLDADGRRRAQGEGLALAALSKDQVQDFWRACSLALPTAGSPIAGGGVRFAPQSGALLVTLDTGAQRDRLRGLQVALPPAPPAGGPRSGLPTAAPGS